MVAKQQTLPKRKMLRTGILGSMIILALMLLLNFWEELFGERPAVVTWVITVSACLTFIGVGACLTIGSSEERKGAVLLLLFVAGLVVIEELTGLSVGMLLLIFLGTILVFFAGFMLWLKWDMSKMRREFEQMEREEAEELASQDVSDPPGPSRESNSEPTH